MTPNFEITGPPASTTTPNATQSIGALQPSDTTSQQRVSKKPVPRYPPGIPIPGVTQSMGSDAASQQKVGKKEVPRYPPGIPIPNATQSMGPLQPSDATSQQRVSKKPVPRYPPGIPIPIATQGMGSDARSQQKVGKKEVPRYPPGIPIPNATQGMGSLQPIDTTSQQKMGKKPIPRYPPGLPIPVAHRVHERNSSSTSSWSAKPNTTENDHAGKRVPLSVDTHNFSDSIFAALGQVPAEPAFHTGTILNSIWVDTPRVGLQDTIHPTTRLLEPFRNGGDILNPAWVNNP
ncbi:hypothetical protein EVJ58_g10641, partial [Rhodofomes roseus]